jgi:hypothetical protein
VKGEPEAKRPKLTLIIQPTETATPLQLECVTQRKLDEILANETALANSIPTGASSTDWASPSSFILDFL